MLVPLQDSRDIEFGVDPSYKKLDFTEKSRIKFNETLNRLAQYKKDLFKELFAIDMCWGNLQEFAKDMEDDKALQRVNKCFETYKNFRRAYNNIEIPK